MRLGVGFNPFRSGLALATDSINIVSCCQSRKLNFFLSIKVNLCKRAANVTTLPSFTKAKN